MINKDMQEVIERTLANWDDAFAEQNEKDMARYRAQLDGIRHLLRALGIRVWYDFGVPSAFRVAPYDNI